MMKKKLLIYIFLFNSLIANADWKNPLVVCPEEVLPKGLSCPDFSKVQNVYSDFPDSMSSQQILDWRYNKSADLRFCRNQEVLKREKIAPGSFSPATIELAWMTVNAAEKVKEKLDAIHSASLNYGIPPQILIGAMKQESLLSSLGISPDGGNYSCGMAQLNIQEWCRSMNMLSETERNALNWPLGISCGDDFIPTNIVKPFYDLAITKIGSKPIYQMNADDYKSIKYSDIYPNKDDQLSSKSMLIFQATKSFIDHCQNIKLSVSVKAQTLKSLFDNYVPTPLKQAEQYPMGSTFSRACNDVYSSIFYPLHTGWLLAVAMYNAGPLEPKLIDHYFKIKNNNYPSLNPIDLIEALHWGGEWKPGTSLVEFIDQDGVPHTQKWYKSCIVQRHIARVVQHVTIPGEIIAKSLEQAPCSPSADVPDYRQKSTGVKY